MLWAARQPRGVGAEASRHPGLIVTSNATGGVDDAPHRSSYALISWSRS